MTLSEHKIEKPGLVIQSAFIGTISWFWLTGWSMSKLKSAMRFFNRVNGSAYGRDSRIAVGGSLVTILFLLIYLFNNILPSINYHTGRWDAPFLFPLMEPVGADFREGYYDPARALLEGKSPYLEYGLIYPPFSALFSVPFTVFPVETAYGIQVTLLFLLNIGSIFLAANCIRLAWRQSDNTRTQVIQNTAVLLFVLVSFYTLTSYGFIFSAERGNFDIYTGFLSILALWVMLKKPNQIWLPVILISMAAQLKIYPAILFFLILWKHGSKSILPILVINLLLLFITGPVNVIEFIQTITFYTLDPYLWTGNHSAVSFNNYLNQYTREYLGILLPGWIFFLAPVLLWIVGFVGIGKNNFDPLKSVLLFTLSVPVMNLLPTVSHDYKLVLLSTPFLILLFTYLIKLEHAPSRFAAIQEVLKIILLMLLMFVIGRTYVYTHPILKNKYPLILFLQLLTILEIYLQRASGAVRMTGGESPSVSTFGRTIQS
jgi:hypothetical protein